MIVCPICQAENEPGALICRRCGSPLRQEELSPRMRDAFQRLREVLAQLPESKQIEVVQKLVELAEKMRGRQGPGNE